MSKFKVGDKVIAKRQMINFNVSEVLTVSRVFNSSMDEVCFAERDSGAYFSCNFELANDWSIYSNTKPLSELTDEQAAELFNYYRNGGKVEVMSDSGEWCDAISFVGFGAEMSYRAKQKTERELFIDLAMGYIRTGGDAQRMFSDMFDDGFKAPKDGE